MPLVMQAKLLRVLEEGEVERIGGDKPLKVDVRVVVATHRNLEELVRDGKFRQDLYHRVVVFPLSLPALRERKEDLPALIEHFQAQVCRQNGWRPVRFAPEAMEALQQYTWPGNVRELRNVVERLLLLATDGVVTRETIDLALPAGAAAGSSSVELSKGPLADRVSDFERVTIIAELERNHHHMTNTAKALGLERSHLYKKCQQLGIELGKGRGAE
jgi:DNA-binding NtrC family response regulator